MTMPPDETPRTEGPTPHADQARSGISAELAGIAEAVNTLIEHMDQSLPDERVKSILEAAKKEEANSRRKMAAAIIGPLVVVIVLVIIAIAQAKINHDQGEDIKAIGQDAAAVADYVQECLISSAPDPERCGGEGAGESFIRYLNCAFLIQPVDRTEAKLNDCAIAAFGRD